MADHEGVPVWFQQWMRDGEQVSQWIDFPGVQTQPYRAFPEDVARAMLEMPDVLEEVQVFLAGVMEFVGSSGDELHEITDAVKRALDRLDAARRNHEAKP